MKKLFFSLFFLVILFVIALPLGIIVAGTGDVPLLKKNTQTSYDNIQQARDVVKRIKPENLKENKTGAVSFTEKELDLVLGYALSYGLNKGKAVSDLQVADGRVKTLVTIHLPDNPIGRYFNMTVDFIERDNLVGIDRVLLGKYEIPGSVINPVVGLVHTALMKSELYSVFFTSSEHITDVMIGSNRVKISYDWDQGTIDALHEHSKTVVVPREQQERLVAYHKELGKIIGSLKNQKTPLLQVLKPMFSFAAGRSVPPGDPAAENRAMLQTLAAWSSGTEIETFLVNDLAAKTTSIPAKDLYLNSRADLSRHFLISAGLAVSTNSRLADLIGVAKEVDDSDGGSGFSFADLAADRAGVRLGETAVGSEKSARAVQMKMAQADNEAYFMPMTNRLPEGITKIDFRSSLKEIDSAAYGRINKELEARLGACGLYR